MSGTLALIAFRLCASMVVAVFVAGCASPADTESRKLEEDVAPASRGADVYVGHGVGGCVGFYVVDGVVNGGFVLPSPLNLGDWAARLSPEQRAMVGVTDAWPICRITRLGDDAYRVLAFGGHGPALGMFQLVVSDVGEAALCYRMSSEDDRSDVAYSGTAVNVDAMATKFNAASAKSKDE